MSDFKRALLTGVSGFIGHNLAGELIRSGYEVSAVVRGGSSHERIPSAAKVYEHDGSTLGMVSILSDSKPDLVFHLASCFLARHTPDDITSLVESNIKFGLQLMEAMAHAGCRRLINTGTGWQHFESQDDNPVCLYAATKTAFESLIQYFVCVENFSVMTLKLHDTYGLNDPRGKLIALLLAAARSGETLLLSPGEQRIDLVHVRDVTAAFLAAGRLVMCNESGSHERLTVSSGNPVSIRELVGTIENVTGRKVNAVWGGRPYREREVMLPWDRGALVSGWMPSISLENGIAELWNSTS